MDYTRCIACKASLKSGEYLSGYDLIASHFNKHGEKLDTLDSLHDGYLCAFCAKAALSFVMNRYAMLAALSALVQTTEDWDVLEVGGEPLGHARQLALKALEKMKGE